VLSNFFVAQTSSRSKCIPEPGLLERQRFQNLLQFSHRPEPIVIVAALFRGRACVCQIAILTAELVDVSPREADTADIARSGVDSSFDGGGLGSSIPTAAIIYRAIPKTECCS
jgi:hypothetical protein